MSPHLSEVLALTERVQAAIDAGDWLLASELDAERRRRLEELVASGQSGAAAGELSSTLAGVRQRTYKMIGDVHHHRRRILREASSIRTSHAAIESYDENAR